MRVFALLLPFVVTLLSTACSGGGGAEGATPANDAGVPPGTEGGIDESGEFGPGFLYGSLGNDGALAVRVAPDGSVYVGGGSNGDIAQGTPLGGDSDGFVSRIAPNGKVAWTRLLTSTYRDGVTGLTLHPDGGVIATTGSSGGTVTVGSVTRIDREGKILWSRSMAPVTPLSAMVTKEGRIFVAGYAFRYETRNASSPLLGAPFEPVVVSSTDGALLELGADGSPIRGRLFAWRLADQPANTDLHAFNTFAESIVPIPGTNSVYVAGVQQDTAGTPLLSGWLRRVELDTLETTWLRFFNAGGVAPSIEDKYAPTTKSSLALEVCVDAKGRARTAWSQLDGGVLVALTSAVDANGAEVSRSRIEALAPVGDPQASVSIACHPDRDEAVMVVGLRAPVNLDTSFQGVLVRLDGAGKVLGRHRPSVTPYPGLSSADAKVMSVAYGAKGIFFVGEAAGTYQGTTALRNTVAGALLTDVLVGRVDDGF
ncbi:MAG: hypothetical protein JST00_29665 [Deltaproteobacteria bacterium]|nr:hypothetical protein [Deltaproteobacteria bacterium]